MDYICTSCNYIGVQKKIKPGSTAIEVLLWTVFFFPGPFYSIWRIVKTSYGCPECGEKIMAPVIDAKGKTTKTEATKIEEAKQKFIKIEQELSIKQNNPQENKPNIVETNEW